MENKSALYLVSFGDSAKYRMESEDGRFTLLNDIREKIERFLRNHFRSITVPKFYREPRVQEVSIENADRFASYPLLTADSVEDIEKVLLTEVSNMESVQEEILNAPYDED